MAQFDRFAVIRSISRISYTVINIIISVTFSIYSPGSLLRYRPKLSGKQPNLEI